MPTPPTVMISSTLYDLAQVRADLVDFLERDMGFMPLVSELHSFPVDPDVSTIENCRRRVNQEADLMVLLIGGRYGSRDAATSRSITNIEYLAAKAKGIPIYTFIKKSVLNALPIWKKNPDADFSDVVDDTAVFEFVVAVREAEQTWTFEFELAQHIISTLKAQFSYLFTQSLLWNRRLAANHEADILELLDGHALRIALEKPSLWEYSLFGELLTQEIRRRRESRHLQRLGIITGSYRYIALADLESWGHSQLQELMGLITGAEKLLNEDFQEAIGPPGTPGNLDRIVFCARGLGLLYDEAIQWSLAVRRTAAPDELKEVMDSMCGFSESLISTLEAAGPKLSRTLIEMEEEVARTGKSDRTLRFSVELPGAADFSRQLGLLQERLSRLT